MKRFHNFEFRKTSRSISIYFGCHLGFTIYGTINLMGYADFMKNPWGVKEKYNICQKQDFLFLTMKARLILGYVGMFVSLLVCAAVIILKDKDDIL